MNDREFLCWLHERLVIVHGEDRCVDYMHKLRAIIRDTPKDRVSPNNACCNSLKELFSDVLKEPYPYA